MSNAAFIVSNAALLGCIAELLKPEGRLQRIALQREISNHLYIVAALGKSSGELTDEDMTIILQRFSLVAKTLSTNGKNQTIARLPIGPEAYAPRKLREGEAT